MLDKNPDQILDSNLVQIQNEFKENVPNIVLCSEPFHKVEFQALTFYPKLQINFTGFHTVDLQDGAVISKRRI